MATFGDGVYQYGGSPVGTSLDLSKIFSTKSKGRAWFVDPSQGTGGSGRSPKNAFTTMDEAFDHIASGDIIYFVGNISEQLSTPAQVFDVTIVGCGNRPRHADATPTGGSYAAATWKTPSSATAATPLLIVRQQGWKLVNILFDGPSDAAAVQIFRDGGSGNDERDGSHLHVLKCKFVAGQNHIEFKGGPSQVRIEDNTFFGATGASLIETVGAGIGTNNYHEIIGNRWKDNATNIDIGMTDGFVLYNVSGNFTGKGFDFTGGASNAVHGNYLWGDYDAGYVAGTSDDWCGNFSMDETSVEVGDNGITTAAPVA